MKSVHELIALYPRVRMATREDNLDILTFVNKVSMRTRKGGLGIDRTPDFFSLTEVQGEHSFTFLFLNQDKSIGGLGCISLTQMDIKGESQWLAYCSDLKFSPEIDPETRVQFYKFFENLISHFDKFEEFQGCHYIMSSILDDNSAARRAFVHSQSKRSRIAHRPVYTYENINVLARIPLPSLESKVKVVSGDQVKPDQLIAFLTSNPENSEVVWSRQEIERRLTFLGLTFKDFKVQLDKSEQIIACGMFLSDVQHRKMKVKPMPLSLKFSQLFTPLLGQITIKENQPIRVAYLSFLKIGSPQPQERARVIHGFLDQFLRDQKKTAKAERFHIVNIQEPKGLGLASRLFRRGYLCNSFTSTLYQVTAQQDERFLLHKSQHRMDFDVVFH